MSCECGQCKTCKARAYRRANVERFRAYERQRYAHGLKSRPAVVCAISLPEEPETPEVPRPAAPKTLEEAEAMDLESWCALREKDRKRIVRMYTVQRS